jgi:sialate O-acetylesterase
MYSSYDKPRDYQLAAGILKAGENVILIRVEDTGGGGGLSADGSEVKLSTAIGDLALAGDWHYQIGSFWIDQNRNQTPTILYNKMIHPLAGLPLRGVLWYQGESNAGGESAVNYEQQFKDMITDWRTHFGRDDLPFYWVQLANFMALQTEANEAGWAVLRNSQTKTLELANTGQAVITDIGEAGDIHPKNKWEVGRRLSLHALKNLYGYQEIAASSPMISTTERLGNKVKLSFDHVKKGLQVKDGYYGYVKGFVYKNATGKWNWARAMINDEDNTITVLPKSGEEIKAIRYGWANNPDGNVFSKEGLPLTPFEVEI